MRRLCVRPARRDCPAAFLEQRNHALGVFRLQRDGVANRRCNQRHGEPRDRRQRRGVTARLDAPDGVEIFNVPLNNALDAVDPASTDAAAVWARYLKDWTFWNHLRTIASAAASALFVAALVVR